MRPEPVDYDCVRLEGSEAVYFSDANLEVLQTGRSAAAGKCQLLVLSYTMRDYKDSRAREFATQGFSRRLKTLARCIDNVFEILPSLNHRTVPSPENLPACATPFPLFWLHLMHDNGLCHA